MAINNECEFYNYIAEIETEIFAYGDTKKSDAEFHPLRKKICDAIEKACSIDDDRCKSIGDHIFAITESHQNRRESAIFILRLIGRPGIIPLNDSENQIERKIVNLVEKTLPDLYDLKLNEKKQTFEKYELIRNIHNNLMGKINILKEIPPNVDEIILLKQDIRKTTANKSLNSYLSIYNFRGVRTRIETIIDLLEELIKISDSTFVFKMDEIREIVHHEITWCNSNINFFSIGYYLPFLKSIEEAVKNLDHSSKERFECEIEPRRKSPYFAEKRYPFHKADKELTITFPFFNRGPGVAFDVIAELDTKDLALDGDVRLGDISPGDFALAVNCIALESIKKADIAIQLSWGRMGSIERKSIILSASVLAQDSNIPWKELEYKEPYSLEVAEDEEFFGRSLKVNTLAKLFLKDRMGSGYITGQKRIGKTSLAKAVGRFVEEHSHGNECIVHYIEYGAYSRIAPVDTVEALGSEIKELLLRQSKNLSEFDSISLKGTLAPLNPILNKLEIEFPNKKFLLILDEFDEMHPEMYRFGALAETFFSNLRTLSAKKNLGFLLVGGEKMPFVLGSQGDQLNKFAREQLNYFSRSDEWNDYTALVTKPVQGYINWNDAALNLIFEITNGHPYYIKLLCTKIFTSAVAERDNELIESDVKHAVNRLVGQLDTNAFAHLWKDGIAADRQESEVRELLRCRFLVAVAKVLRNRQQLNAENIGKYKHSTNLPQNEIQAVLNEFCRREILKEESGVYEFIVPLFGLWLEEVGINSLILDSLGEDFEADIKAAEEKAYVTANEITELVKDWPVYRGNHITTDNVRAWLEQVNGYQNQRLLFKLLSNLRIVPFQQIREYLQTAHTRMVVPLVQEFVKQRKSDRRNDILITYIDGPAKSGAHYARLYAEENSITSSSVIAPIDFSRSVDTHEAKTNTNIKTLVIIDDILATGNTMGTNLKAFVEANEKAITDRSLSIMIIALAATDKGEEHVRSVIKKLSFDIDLRVCEPISSKSFAFQTDLGIWSNLEEKERAKALCLDLGSRIYRGSPLGYESQGLLYVFTDTCPNNTLPILHAKEKKAGGWFPIFERPKN